MLKMRAISLIVCFLVLETRALKDCNSKPRKATCTSQAFFTQSVRIKHSAAICALDYMYTSLAVLKGPCSNIIIKQCTQSH